MRITLIVLNNYKVYKLISYKLVEIISKKKLKKIKIYLIYFISMLSTLNLTKKLDFNIRYLYNNIILIYRNLIVASIVYSL